MTWEDWGEELAQVMELEQELEPVQSEELVCHWHVGHQGLWTDDQRHRHSLRWSQQGCHRRSRMPWSQEVEGER